MKSLDFSSSGRANVRDNSTGWINGTLPLPDIYKIGRICKNNHGIKGKSVRHVKCGRCVICIAEKHKKVESEKHKSHSNETHQRAMALYERQNEEADIFDF